MADNTVLTTDPSSSGIAGGLGLNPNHGTVFQVASLVALAAAFGIQAWRVPSSAAAGLLEQATLKVMR